MFGHKKKTIRHDWDRERLVPVIRASICTGEEEAGFMDKESGKFTGVLLLRSPLDLETFRSEWDVEGEIKKIY